MTDVRPEAVFIEEGVKSALINTILDMDFSTTTDTIYSQIKVSDGITYIEKLNTVTGACTYSPNNTAWADRVSATYTTRAE